MDILKETLCWQCQNFNRCSWAYGVPVEGWDATPTKVEGRCGLIDSFMVHRCPDYLADKRLRTTMKEIAKIIGKYEAFVQRHIKNDTNLIKQLLEEKGYKLYIDDELEDECASYYLERLDNA